MLLACGTTRWCRYPRRLMLPLRPSGAGASADFITARRRARRSLSVIRALTTSCKRSAAFSTVSAMSGIAAAVPCFNASVSRRADKQARTRRVASARSEDAIEKYHCSCRRVTVSTTLPASLVSMPSFLSSAKACFVTNTESAYSSQLCSRSASASTADGADMSCRSGMVMN